MSNEVEIHAAGVGTTHEAHGHHEHHEHHDTFITKYVFSQDHKMILQLLTKYHNPF